MPMYYTNIFNEPSMEPPEDRRRTVYTCSCCREAIKEGDEYWNFHELGYICLDCMESAHHLEAEVDW